MLSIYSQLLPGAWTGQAMEVEHDLLPSFRDREAGARCHERLHRRSRNGELRSRDLVPSTQPGIESLSSLHRSRQLQSIAMKNYRLALQDLSSVLSRAATPDRTEQDLDALFALWFLMINFEQYGSELVENTHIHLNGIRSFLSRALKNAEIIKLPPASQQMLHFIWFVYPPP